MKTVTRYFLQLVSLSLVLGLSACFDDDDNNTTNTGNTTPTTVTLSGTAATGAAFVGDVEAINAQGGKTSTTIDADGLFSVEINNAPPFMLRAVASNGAELYSFSQSGGTVNITELTNLAVHLANEGTAPDTVFDNWGSNQLADADVQDAMATVRTNLQQQFTTHSLPADYDFFTQAFSVGTAGIDALMDDILIEIDFQELFANSISILDPDNNQSLLTFNVDPGTGSGTGTGGATGSFDTATLTVSGTAVVSGVSVSIPNVVINNAPVPGPAEFSSLENDVANAYGASGTVTVTLINDTATRRTFRLQFSGIMQGITANYDLTYDYVIN